MQPRVGLYTIKYHKNIVTPPGWLEYNCSGNFAEREAWHFKDFFFERKVDNFDFIGLFSPRYQEKININASQIRSLIYTYTDYEAFVFNPFPWNAFEWYNVWEQGFYCHPGLKSRTIYLLDNIGAPRTMLTGRHSLQVAAYCNYIVGSLDFWKRYLCFLEPFYAFVESERARGPLYDECPYDNGPVTYIPFIFERLLSSYIDFNRNEKIKVISTGDWASLEQKNMIHDFDILDNILVENYSYETEWEIRRLIDKWNFRKKLYALSM